MITSEGLITSLDGFGTLDWDPTPVQRAACRARDGLPLAELRDHPEVVAAFGGPEAVAALPSERGVKVDEFFNIASARTAKTTMACAAAIVDSQTVDLSGLGHGEIPRLSLLSLKVDVADVMVRRLTDTMLASKVLRGLVLDTGADSVLVRHPSGKPIELKVVAGGKTAGGLAGRWSAGLIADEAPRMQGRDEAVTNLDDALSVIRERLLPGAQIQCIGSPWAPSGPVYDVVQECFGKPTEHLVVMRTTGPAGNPKHWTPERLAALREKDEVAWRINALGEFLDPETGLLSPVAVRRAVREEPLELPPQQGAHYAGAIDTSEGSTGGNPFTLVIVEVVRQRDQLPHYRVALAREWRGLGPEESLRCIAEECRRYGIKRARADQYAGAANAALARRFGLDLHVVPWTASTKLEAFTNLATILHSGQLELSPDRVLRRDLLSVKRRTTQTGMTIVLPKTSDGRHCDFAPALAAALDAGTGRAVITGAYSSLRSLRDSLPRFRDGLGRPE